ncbi:MAG: thioredoxin domain-containing protein [bacterium]
MLFKRKDEQNNNKIILTSAVIFLFIIAFVYLQFNKTLQLKKLTSNVGEQTENFATTSVVEPVTDSVGESLQPNKPSYSDIANDSKEVKKIDVSEVLGKDEIVKIKTIEPISATDHVRGDANAPVQIIIYGDFDCPSTALFSEIINQARKEFGNKIVIAFRHFPLSTAHQTALPAAIAAECANEQGKFWEMSDEFFKATAKNQLFSERFSFMAKNLKLNTQKFDACYKAEKYKDVILAQAEKAKQFGVIGTPTTFVNGQVVNGATPMDDGKHGDGSYMEGLRSIINKQLQKK